jgi:hypothetical protein
MVFFEVLFIFNENAYSGKQRKSIAFRAERQPLVEIGKAHSMSDHSGS